VATREGGGREGPGVQCLRKGAARVKKLKGFAGATAPIHSWGPIESRDKGLLAANSRQKKREKGGGKRVYPEKTKR